MRHSPHDASNPTGCERRPVQCSDVQELISDFLLGELNTTDEASLRAHVDAGCPKCAGLIAETETVLGRLYDVLPPETPPPDVEERLAARVEPISTAVRSGTLWTGLKEHDWVFTFAAICVASVLVWLGSWGTFSATHSQEASRENELHIALGKRKDQIGSLRRELADNAGFAEAMRSDELYFLTFNAVGDGNAAIGRSLWDPRARRLGASFSRLPETDAGHALALWLDAPEPVRLTTFTATAQGDASFVVELPAELPDATRLVVSDEPADSRLPGKTILAARLGDSVRVASQVLDHQASTLIADKAGLGAHNRKRLNLKVLCGY